MRQVRRVGFIRWTEANPQPPLLLSAVAAKQAGVPLVMFETNTGACGGFPGLSDSFAAALWVAPIFKLLDSAHIL